MGGLLNLVQRGGVWANPTSLLLAVPNVTAHPSTASVPITVLLYDGPLLCGFNVVIKRLTCHHTPMQIHVQQIGMASITLSVHKTKN